MKKILGLCAAFLCAYQISNAQTQKGNQNLILNLGYTHYNTSSSAPLGVGAAIQDETNQGNSINIGPSYSYFINNGLELGAGLAYSHHSLLTTNDGSGNFYTDKTTDYNYGGNLFLRKYVLYDNKFGFRFGPYASYSYGKNTSAQIPVSLYDGSNHTHNYDVGGNFDLVYYPSNKLGVSATLIDVDYTHSDGTGNQATHSNNFGVNPINSGLSLSIFWVLSK